MASRRLIAILGSLSAALLPTLILLGWPLISPTTFAFRDAGHFYYPLYRWINNAPLAETPLWNPYDNLGVAVADEATSALFYPARLLLHAPIASFAFRYELYILFHGLLAAGGAWFLARTWRLSLTAASLAGMSYGCAGAVVFQYCNVVFLVGAGWLPFALATGWRMLRSKDWKSTLPASICLAMMVLGGDAQAAYIAVIALLLSVVLKKGALRKIIASADRRPQACKQLAQSIAQVGLLAIVAGLLSAPQIYASFRAVRSSPRFVTETPRTTWEIVATRAKGERSISTVAVDVASLASPPVPYSHHDVSYDFSVAPWHWAEFVWPRFSGSLFPVYRRWIAIVPSEDRVWTPTLYLGFIPFVLAMTTFFTPTRSAKVRWLKQLATWGLLTALGWYGIGWIINEAWLASGGGVQGNELVASGFGGLYWLQSVFLPGFIGFRYPAKFLIIASLAISLLGACGYDELKRRNHSRLMIILIGVIAASLLLLVASLAITWFASDWLTQMTSADDSFGPLDSFGAMSEVARSAMWALLLAGGLLFVLKRRKQFSANRLAAVILLATLVDLSFAQQHLIAVAPEATFEQRRHPGNESYSTDFRDATKPIPVNRRPPRFPAAFAKESSPDRISELALAERVNLFGRHNLPAAKSRGSLMADSFLSVRRADYLAFYDAVLLESASSESELRRLAGWATTNQAPNEQADISPMAFSVRRIDQFPSLDVRTPSAIAKRTRETLYPAGNERNFTESASVETDSNNALLKDNFDSGSVQLVSLAPEEWLLSAQFSGTGFIVLRQAYDADWRITATSSTGDQIIHPELLRTNRVLQGFVLPAGNWRVSIEYRPVGLFIASLIAGGAWLLLFGYGIRRGISTAITQRRNANP